jgi:hypothetical protein
MSKLCGPLLDIACTHQADTGVPARALGDRVRKTAACRAYGPLSWRSVQRTQKDGQKKRHHEGAVKMKGKSSHRPTSPETVPEFYNKPPCLVPFQRGKPC